MAKTSASQAGQATAVTSKEVVGQAIAQPADWSPTYSTTSFIRYARQLRANGHYITAYHVSAASTPAQKRMAATLRKAGHAGPYVVANHTTGELVSTKTWAEAYAATMVMSGKPLAKSVVASLGK